jgi:hypothetical protein
MRRFTVKYLGPLFVGDGDFKIFFYEQFFINSIYNQVESQDSSIITAMAYRLDGPSSIRGRGNIFLMFVAFRPALVPTQPV